MSLPSESGMRHHSNGEGGDHQKHHLNSHTKMRIYESLLHDVNSLVLS
jgi:hypothetical protein